MISEDELNKAIDIKHNIVRVALVDKSKKAYRISDLKNKTVGQILQDILEKPACPLHGQVGIKLYEFAPGEQIVNCLEADENIQAVLKRWESPVKKKVQYELLLKKDTDNRVTNAPAMVPLGKNMTELKDQFKRSASALITKKKVFNIRTLLQSMEPFIDETRCIYKLASEKSKAEGRIAKPLDQFLILESQQQGFSMNDPEIVQIRQHQQLLVTWINLQLMERSMHISDLHKDIRDGVALINLLEILTGKSLKEFHKRPSSVQQKLQNCDLLIQFLHKLDIKCQSQPVDIFNGNMSVMFGILYVLVKTFRDKKFARSKKNRQRLYQDFNPERDISLNLSGVSEGGESPTVVPREVQTERIARKADQHQITGPTLSCVDLENQIQALDNREKLSHEDLMKMRKQNENVKKVGKLTDMDIEQMMETAIKGDLEQDVPQSDGGNDDILDEILQTAKRLKEMKISRAPVIQKTRNINLSDLNDEELEAMLNDGNFDLADNLETLSLEFEDDAPTRNHRDNNNEDLNIEELDAFLSDMEKRNENPKPYVGKKTNNQKQIPKDFDDDLDSLTLNLSNDPTDEDFDLDDL